MLLCNDDTTNMVYKNTDIYFLDAVKAKHIWLCIMMITLSSLVFFLQLSRNSRKVSNLRYYTSFLLANKVECKLVKSSTFKNLKDGMVCGRKLIKLCLTSLQPFQVSLRLSFCCISTKSIAFNPWKFSTPEVSSATPGIFFNERKASPAKSFAVITSWSITVNPIIALSCVHCSNVIVPNSKHSSKTGLRVFCKHEMEKQIQCEWKHRLQLFSKPEMVKVSDTIWILCDVQIYGNCFARKLYGIVQH